MLFPRNRIVVFALPLVLLLGFCKSPVGQKPATEKKTGGYIIRLDSAQLIRDLVFLSSPALAGRETGTPGNETARNYIASRFDSLGLQKVYTNWLQPFVAKDKPASNVIGVIKGTEWPDQYYVLSAHFDHLGQKGDKIYAGADDNASGTACLLAMAAYFRQHPPKHSLILTAFDAEEKGLLGSRYFAEHPPVDIKNIRLNVNMDMVSRNDKNEIYVAGLYHYPFLLKYIDSIPAHPSVRLLLGHDDPSMGSNDWTSQSDHFPFHQKGIPFLYFGVEDHPDYHQPGDTFDKIDKSFYYRVCNMISELVLAADRETRVWGGASQ